MKSTVVLSAGALLLGGAQALSSSASSSDVGSSTSSSDPSTSTAPASTKGLGNFVYLGCYVDLYHQQRTLTGPSYSDAAGMTWEACAAFCAGSNYFGTEYGTECYCGSSLDQSLKADETECNAPCAGDATEYCGASFRLDIFQNQDYTPPATPTDPATPPAPTGDFQYAQCQTEGAGVRALDGDHTAKDGMTVEICLAYCKGYAYAGLEYGRECYCGNTINNGSVFAPPGDCNTPCGGKVTQTCGGPSRLSLYYLSNNAAGAPPPFGPLAKYQMTGCYKDTRTHALPFLFSSKSMTPELCAAYVRSLAAKPTPTLIPYYYVEDKQFCYGGSTFDFGPKAKVTSLTGAKACTATCAGYMPTKKATVSVTPTGTAKCGGHGMFNLYAATTLPFAPAITKAA